MQYSLSLLIPSSHALCMVPCPWTAACEGSVQLLALGYIKKEKKSEYKLSSEYTDLSEYKVSPYT